MSDAPKLLILVGSPRRAGNSATLARAVQRGAQQAGTQTELRFIDDAISSFLRDCRTCRLPDGECAIADNFLGIVHQIQAYSRYTHSQFVGVVRGVGNSRSEVMRDPGGPLVAAEQLGREIFARKYSDYRLDTPRSGQVWPPENTQ